MEPLSLQKLNFMLFRCEKEDQSEFGEGARYYSRKTEHRSLGQKNGSMTSVRLLCLLEGIMHKMPSNLFKQLAESILKSFTLADPMVRTLPFHAQFCIGKMFGLTMPAQGLTASAM